MRKPTAFTRPCLHCGKDFKDRPSKKYCSRQCCNLAKIGVKKSSSLTCAHCGNKFYGAPRQKFCSHKCYTDSRKGHAAHNKLPPKACRCEACGREFETTPSDDRRYCSKACFYGAQKGRRAWNTSDKIKKPCATCGVEISVTPGLAERTKFCSRACANVGKSQVRGESHPLYSLVTRKCEHCGSEFQTRPAKIAMGEGRFCSRRCVGAYSVALQGGRRSSIELMVETELEKRGIPFEAQKSFRWWTVDFYVPHLRLVIECDGDYWHSRPTQVAKDAKKDDWLSRHGERVVRLPEHQIRADPAAALDRALAS